MAYKCPFCHSDNTQSVTYTGYPTHEDRGVTRTDIPQNNVGAQEFYCNSCGQVSKANEGTYSNYCRNQK